MSAIEGSPDIHQRCAEGPRLTQTVPMLRATIVAQGVRMSARPNGAGSSSAGVAPGRGPRGRFRSHECAPDRHRPSSPTLS
jgi:hypothetical protein